MGLCIYSKEVGSLRFSPQKEARERRQAKANNNKNKIS
jgi:hypothetical protein